MTISVPEIIALLKRTDPESIEAIKAFNFHSPEAAPFLKFCEALYDKGFDHGYTEARSDALNGLEGHDEAQTIINLCVNGARRGNRVRRDG